MHCCCSGVDEGRGESAGYEPEMGRGKEGEDKGAVVEEAGEEGVCALNILSERPRYTFVLLRTYTARIYTDTESCFVIKNHSSHFMRASRVGIIERTHTEQTSEQAKCNAQDSQRGRHISAQLQALQHSFIREAALEGPTNGEAEHCARPGGTAML